MGKSDFAQDEDCLTVSVWTPAADSKRRPVFVWLHGGAYQSGGGNQVFYDGGNLAAAGDMVVVGVNYRLGALGYLYLPGAEAHGAAPANRGLLDQMAALEWVQQNIEAFGGDPGKCNIGRAIGRGRFGVRAAFRAHDRASCFTGDPAKRAFGDARFGAGRGLFGQIS